MPDVLAWAERTGPLAVVLAVPALFAAIVAFGLCYLFVACVVAAAIGRLFVPPDQVPSLVLDAAWPSFDRALLRTLRRLRIAR